LVERQKGEFTATLTLKKLKDEDDGQKFTVHLSRIVICKDKMGQEVSTLVVESVEPGVVEGTKAVQKKSIPPSMQMLISVVEQLIGESENSPFKPFADGPLVKAVSDEVVRRRYYFRMAEKAKPGEDPQKLADRQRQAFYRTVGAALEAEVLMACQRDGERFLWIP
jgi:hypothetical protein